MRGMCRYLLNLVCACMSVVMGGDRSVVWLGVLSPNVRAVFLCCLSVEVGAPGWCYYLHV